MHELKSLGASKIRILSDLKLLANCNIEKIIHKTTFIQTIDGKETDISRIMKKFEFLLRKWKDNWSSHFWYPFKAKMRPPVARALINIVLKGSNGLVLDPFCGSGTTLVEARWLRADSIGIDVVPFYVELTKAKCSVFEGWNKSIDVLLQAYSSRASPKSAKAIRDEIKLSMELTKNAVDELKIKPGKFKALVGDSRKIKLDDESIDGIVTSPPYASAIDYLEMDKHGLAVMGISIQDLKDSMIYADKKYEENMKLAYEEMNRVLRPNGRIAIVIGDSKGSNNIEFTKRFFRGKGYKLLLDLQELIISRGVYHINFDHILIFEKSSGN